MTNPDDYLEAFRDAGADGITVHYETCKHLSRTISHIKELGARAGVSLNPSSPMVLLKDILSEVDLVLLMTVNPGFGGQKFLPFMYRKIRDASSLIKAYNEKIDLEIDGGIHTRNIRKAAAAGADVIVIGAGIFNSHGIVHNVRQLRRQLIPLEPRK
jgi:ribulose-phosphate 3-epimerase